LISSVIPSSYHESAPLANPLSKLKSVCISSEQYTANQAQP